MTAVPHVDKQLRPPRVVTNEVVGARSSGLMEIVTHRRARSKRNDDFPANSLPRGIKFSLTLRETLVHNAAHEAAIPHHHQAGAERMVCGLGRRDPRHHHARQVASRVPGEPAGRATAHGRDASRRGPTRPRLVVHPGVDRDRRRDHRAAAPIPPAATGLTYTHRATLRRHGSLLASTGAPVSGDGAIAPSTGTPGEGWGEGRRRSRARTSRRASTMHYDPEGAAPVVGTGGASLNCSSNPPGEAGCVAGASPTRSAPVESTSPGTLIGVPSVSISFCVPV